jgi:RimJ/RimL family protein N-acetyltransferase
VALLTDNDNTWKEFAHFSRPWERFIKLSDTNPSTRILLTENDKYLYYQGDCAVIEPVVYQDGATVDMPTIETDFYTITMDNDGSFAEIILKESGKVVGSFGINEYKLEDKLTEFDDYLGREIGFVLAKDYWGRGLMPEAVNAVMNYLFDECDLDFLTCGYYNFNLQSKRVQEKCGFKPYRALKMDTRMGTTEEGTLNLAINPKKNIKFNFSHPETLIYKD